MAISAKICGVTTPDAVAAVIAGGASHMGLNFYPPSPRYVSPADAAALAAETPGEVCTVGVFVDADDHTLGAALDAVGIGLLQLHGDETVERVAAVRARFGVPVMKVIRVAGPADIALAGAFAEVADWLLFDARAPADMVGALPGGNALSFDWRLIAGSSWPVPWMLSGGLEIANLAEAVSVSGARLVDVSSGVEDRRGHKSPAMIKAFLARVAGL
ncbi:MAG: phosphoribosylanthranilate isomerase [Proteobacteria bacterium]|nr:phosphoribosylanthranilate isomerase [Pseudomonadota bacterium]